jgi:hypothetical protein
MEKRKFKVGDKVIVIRDNHCLCGHGIGDVGIVYDIANSPGLDYGGPIQIRFLNTQQTEYCYYMPGEIAHYPNALQRLKERYGKAKV